MPRIQAPTVAEQRRHQTRVILDAARSLGDTEQRRTWKRYNPDPFLLDKVDEPHERGSFLVAAVFQAYLTIYRDRVEDLKRIATGGTGVLPAGQLHPALVERTGDRLLDGWIFGANRPAVDCVWRAGKRVVQDGAHRSREAVAARYRATLAKLLA